VTGDHTLLDVQILDAKQQPARPWLTVVLDDYSRAVAGYTVFLGDPTAEQTALALHQAAGRKANPAWPVTGLPDVLYSHHGSDFTSARLERVCLDTHIRLMHSRVGVPQGRGKIERFFGTVTTGLLPHLPGHIPHGTRGQPVTPPALTLEQLDGILERFVVEDYHPRPHSETGQPPVQRWLADGWLPRLPAHPEDLDLLLLTAATGRKVQRDGIRFASTRYVPPVLVAHVGETVTIRYDPRDAAELRMHHQGQYLCRATAPELAADTVTLQRLQQARTARCRQLKQQLRDRRSLPTPCPPTSATSPPCRRRRPPTWRPASSRAPRCCPCSQHRRHRHIGCGPMPPTDRAAERSLLGTNDDGRRILTAAIGERGGRPPAEPQAAAPFLDTREHRRFTEFADAVRLPATPARRTGSSGSATSTQPTPAPGQSPRGSCRPGPPSGRRPSAPAHARSPRCTNHGRW